MNYNIFFLPQIEGDIHHAYNWYELKSIGLGYEFIRTFYASIYEVQRYPLAYHCVYKEFRRKLLKRFPYALYYKIKNEDITVFAVFHTARDPKIVNDRLIEI